MHAAGAYPVCETSRDLLKYRTVSKATKKDFIYREEV